MNIFHTVKELWPGHGLLYGTKSRGNNYKTKHDRFTSLFMTYHLNVMHAPVKFHEYIPNGLGVMARHEVGCTDRCAGRTGVTFMPFRCSSNWRGHNKWCCQ